MEFCKAYNAATESQRGNVIPVEITVYEDRSLHVHHQDAAGRRAASRRPQASQKGSGEPHKAKVATADRRSRCARSPEQKLDDLNANDIDAAAKIIAGTARSMGITVESTGRSGSTRPTDPIRPVPG